MRVGNRRDTTIVIVVSDKLATTLVKVTAMLCLRTMRTIIMLARQYCFRRHQTRLDRHVEPDHHEQGQDQTRPATISMSSESTHYLTKSILSVAF